MTQSTEELERLLAELETRLPLRYDEDTRNVYTAEEEYDGEQYHSWLAECGSPAFGRLSVAAINALPELVALRKEAAFLLERLADFDRSGDTMTEDGQRDWYGHVMPSLSRLRAALNQEPKP